MVKKYVALVPTFSFVNAFNAFNLVVAPVPPLAITTVPVTLAAFAAKLPVAVLTQAVVL